MRAHIGWYALLALVLYARAAFAGEAAILLDEKVEVAGRPQSRSETRWIEIAQAGIRPGIIAGGNVKSGTVTVRLVDAEGEEKYRQTLEAGRAQQGARLSAFAPGRATLEITTNGFTGIWQVILVQVPDRGAFRPLLVSGPAMIAAALAFVMVWAARSHVKLRWFWAGAGIWAAGIALKFVWATLANEAIFDATKNVLSRNAHVAVGSVYIGALTGVFEIGATLLAALVWRRIAASGERAVAIGIGAGAFEALVLGAGATANAFAAMSGVPQTDIILVLGAYSMASTPLVWLAGPVERVLAVLCHTASRTLVLFGVASGRRGFFWWGFFLLSAVDVIVGWVHLSERIGKMSLWWIELAIVPFAVASVPVIRWCLRHWPPDAGNAARDQKRPDTQSSGLPTP